MIATAAATDTARGGRGEGVRAVVVVMVERVVDGNSSHDMEVVWGWCTLQLLILLHLSTWPPPPPHLILFYCLILIFKNVEILLMIIIIIIKIFSYILLRQFWDMLVEGYIVTGVVLIMSVTVTAVVFIVFITFIHILLFTNSRR